MKEILETIPFISVTRWSRGRRPHDYCFPCYLSCNRRNMKLKLIININLILRPDRNQTVKTLYSVIPTVYGMRKCFFNELKIF